MRELITKIHEEASALDLPTAMEAQPKAKAAVSTKSFCATYTKTVRPALLIGLSLTRLFRRGNIADGIAHAIAFLDLTCGNEPTN